MAESALAEEFPELDHDDWRALAEAALKGGSFERLRSRTYDGIIVEPLYPAASGGPLLGRPGTRWDIRCEHALADARELNAALLADLEGGATSVRVVVPADADAAWFDAALEGVLMDIAGVHLRPVADPLAAGTAVLDHLAERGFGSPIGSLGGDPIGALAGSGGSPDVTRAEIERLAATAPPEGLRIFDVDTSAFSGAGSSEAQEIGVALAAATAYLRALTDRGHSPPQAASRIGFTVTADADVFATMAKLRALRRAWNHVLDVCGVGPDARATEIAARQADRMLSARDPWVNLLRGTAACVGAALGGADAVIVAPFDAVAGRPEALGRRLARNTQLLLLEESHLGHVVDPAAGSGHVEALTDQLCDAAWANFVSIESRGGLVAAVADGSLAAALAATAAARSRNVATRRDPLTGVSEFPNLDEPAFTRTPVGFDRPRASGPVSPLPQLELDEPFEVLRAASDQHLARHGARPSVFLACLGPVAVHTARASWARNVCEAGGIRPSENDGFSSPADLAAAFTDSGLTVAVLCSDDATYADWGTAAAAALRRAGAVRVYLAGRVDVEGVDEAVHVGTDIADALRGMHDVLGVDR